MRLLQVGDVLIDNKTGQSYTIFDVSKNRAYNASFTIEFYPQHHQRN